MEFETFETFETTNIIPSTFRIKHLKLAHLMFENVGAKIRRAEIKTRKNLMQQDTEPALVSAHNYDLDEASARFPPK